MSEYEHVHYRLECLEALKAYPGGDVVVLDWNDDLEMIRRFYKKWGAGDDVDPPGPDETEIGLPVAVVNDGEILSFAGTFYFRKGEAEIGPVATVSEARGKGYAHRVVSEAARRALEKGLIVTLATEKGNLSMRAVAEDVGMTRIAAPGGDS